MATIPDQIREARARLRRSARRAGADGARSPAALAGRGAGRAGAAFLPGAHHQALGWVLGVAAIAVLYGLGSLTGSIPWERASINGAGDRHGGDDPDRRPRRLPQRRRAPTSSRCWCCPLLYAAFFFPQRWAWPLSVELILVAGLPLLNDAGAIDDAFLPRYVALVGRLPGRHLGDGRAQGSACVDAEIRQRDIANRDPLTGVANRRSFDATMRRELAARTLPLGGRREADRSPLTLLLLDLDDFKGVNDRHGHQVGDAVLCEAAESALSILRSTDTLARIGGDEFAVVAPGAHGEGARRMAEAIRLAVGAGRGGGPADARRLGRLGGLPRRRPGLRDADAFGRRADAADQARRGAP